MRVTLQNIEDCLRDEIREAQEILDNWDSTQLRIEMEEVDQKLVAAYDEEFPFVEEESTDEESREDRYREQEVDMARAWMDELTLRQKLLSALLQGLFTEVRSHFEERIRFYHHWQEFKASEGKPFEVRMEIVERGPKDIRPMDKRFYQDKNTPDLYRAFIEILSQDPSN